MASVDVTVRGGGIFGLSVAWACLQSGARVQVIEAARIGAGASGGVVGALSPHAPEGWTPMKALQLDSLLMVESWWRQVHARGGVDPLYARTGRMQPIADAAALAKAHARTKGAQDLWRGQAEWQVQPPGGGLWAPLSPEGPLVHDTLSARIFPRTALAALAAALRAGGAAIWEGDEGGAAPEEAGLVIHATGVQGLTDLGAGKGVKGQALLLQASPQLAAAEDLARLPQIYAPGLHIVAHGNGTIAIGSTSENAWDQPGPDAQLDALLARACAVLPVLRDCPVIERWAGIRPRAASRNPVLDHWPGRPGHIIANGGFKIGFGMAPLVADLAARLIGGEESAVPGAFRIP